MSIWLLKTKINSALYCNFKKNQQKLLWLDYYFQKWWADYLSWEKKEQSLQDLKLKKKIHEKNVVIKTVENFLKKRNTLLKIKATI